MEEKGLDKGVTVNELPIETEEEIEARLDREESSRKLKAIIFVVIPLLIGFLTFTYFFLNSIEEKNKLLKQGQSKQQTSQDSRSVKSLEYNIYYI